MANCTTCGQALPNAWVGCASCVRGSHHCKYEDCECPVCDHPAGLKMPMPVVREVSTDGTN